MIDVALSAEKFDQALHGGLDAAPVLPECGDLAVYVKPRATVSGKAGAVLTFTVQLPDGTRARAQAVTTVVNLKSVVAAINGWERGGHL